MATLNGITLPHLLWQDEFDYSPVGEDIKVSLEGTLIKQESYANEGRPITLIGGSNFGFIQRSVLTQLQSLEHTSNTVMTLVLDDSRVFNVEFRHGQKGITASPVTQGQPDNDTYYKVTIRLRVVL